MKMRALSGVGIVALGLFVVACGSDPAASESGAVLLSVVPAGGAEMVDPNGPVVIRFDHPIHGRMVDYVALHRGDVNGAVVAGLWSLREGGTELVFEPAHPLEPATDYTIHVGGGMTDTRGRHVDLGTHGPHMGGQWAGSSMMGGTMMDGSHPHMGSGWRHPANGSHGMTFTFRTAA
jgi:hypothetical protein